MTEKLGILGGAFDPIHYGHLLLAAEARFRLVLDRVLFVPTYHSAHQNKSIGTSFADRYAMVEAAISGFAEFEISDIETQFSGASYTVQTLGRLKELRPDSDLFFIIGADNVQQLDTWYKPQELVQLATLAVAARPGFKLKSPDGENIVQFEMPLIDISATTIRERVQRGEPIRLLVPTVVETYIGRKGLYHG